MTSGADAQDWGIDRLVRALTLTTFIQWAGASAIVPMLPLYLRRHGGSDALVGAVMAAFFVAGVLFQYPGGKLADHWGRRNVLLLGIVLYAAASLCFLIPVDPRMDILLRGLQGAGSGLAEVAALSMVAAAVPAHRRGAAFGRVYGGLIAGLAVGPLLGSLAGAEHMNEIFVASAVAALVACLPVLGHLPAEAFRTGHPASGTPADRPRRPWRSATVLGALVAGAAIGLTTGIYETCWTLLLQTKHATDWQIGLSWTLFATPFVVMARPGGWLADHLDRRRLAVVALLVSATCCAVYPWLHGLALIFGLATLEAVGAAVALPSIQSLLTSAVPDHWAGRAQGLFATSETGTTGVAAAAGGALFAIAPWTPFLAGSLASAALVATLPFWWRRAQGRIVHPSPAPSGSAGRTGDDADAGSPGETGGGGTAVRSGL